MAGETAGRAIGEIRPTYFGALWDAYQAGWEGEDRKFRQVHSGVTPQPDAPRN
jgi:hypothetical protein